MIIQKNDCVRVINGHGIFCHDKFDKTRKNITCTSKQFEEIVSDIKEPHKIHQLFCDNWHTLTDIQIISVLGYY